MQFGLATHYLENKQLNWFYSQLMQKCDPGISEEELRRIVDEVVPPISGTKMEESMKQSILKIFKFDSI